MTMIHVWRLITILFFVSIPVWYVPVILSDLAHPERWDGDWMHDPRVYLPMLAIVAVLGLLLALHMYWSERRKQR
jgi:hypothetical protein